MRVESGVRASGVFATTFALSLGVLVFAWSGAALAATEYGAVVMDGAIKIEPGRYRMTKDWEKVIRFYQSAYGGNKGYLWRNIASTPKVKAIHIANQTDGAKTWEGINLYETKGEVYAFVIKAEPEADNGRGRGVSGRSRASGSKPDGR